MRNLILRALAIAFCVSSATGCSAAATSIASPLPLTNTSEAPATATVASRRTLPEGAVEYSRTGGIAGIDERWRFFADGRIIDAQGVEYAIPAADMADLFAKIEALEFYDWDTGPRRLDSCADCFTYTISVHHDGQSNQLSFVDGQADVPEGIWTILDDIQAILNMITEDQAN